MAEKNFNQRVYQIVKKIPQGKVASYGQIAALLGSPRAARAVGWALGALENPAIPWQRVISSKGYLTIVNAHVSHHQQKQLLEKEGVVVQWDDQKNMYKVDLDVYLWHP